MVSEKKKQLVQDLVKEIKSYSIVGLVNMESLPAQQLQNMRAMLREKDIKIVMTRKKLISLALKESKLDNVAQLEDQIKGMPALIFSKDNPFTLYSILQKNKSKAPAKAGQTAPNDIVVKAGMTSFAPGPIISELAAVGIKTKVTDGKLEIVGDVVVAKEGDPITAKLAENLKRLDIQPMEVGLDLVAVWENGTIFAAKQLHVDEQEYFDNFVQAAQWATNLAMETAFPTTETTELLLQKAFREAKAVALEQNIMNDVTKDEILGKAEAQALSVKSEGKIEVGAAPVKEEPAPVEEPKEEPAPVEEPKEESAPVEEPKEEPAPAEEPKEEPAPVEEPKEEEKVEPVEEKPTEEEIKKAMENIPDEKIEINQSKQEEESELHPKQGDVSTDQAQELLEKLQKEGTLRKED
jgi:large subunit ribosomal protein L10